MHKFLSRHSACKPRLGRDRRRGTATVECAIVLPVFVLLLLGTMEACSMIFLRQSVELAAYESARAAVLPQTTLVNVQSAGASLLSARKVKNFSISVSPSNFQTAAYGTFIRVSASAPVADNSLFGSIFYKDMNVVGTVDFMKEY